MPSNLKYSTVVGMLLLVTAMLTPRVSAQPTARTNASPAVAPGGIATQRETLVRGLIVKYRSDSELARLTKHSSVRANSGNHSTAPGELTAGRQAEAQVVAGRFGTSLTLRRKNALGHIALKSSRWLTRAEADDLAVQLQSQADVEWAVADFIVPLAAVPNDYYWGSQWPLQGAAGIGAADAWDIYNVNRASTDPLLPIIAIVDSGYRRHEDLALPEMGTDTFDGVQPPLDTGDQYSPGECPNDPTGSQAFNSWHGTRIQGVIAAMTGNGLGVAGVDSRLKVLHSRFSGKCGGYLSEYLDAVNSTISYRSSAGQRVRVINLSQAGRVACPAAVQEVINLANANSIAVVVAAGNSASEAAMYSPANCNGVIAVAATNRSGGRTSYSNYGGPVALAAPGGEFTPNGLDAIPTTTHSVWVGQVTQDDIATAYTQDAGTSFATPHVAAVAGMMLNVKPTLTPAEVKAKLMASAKPFPGACSGCGAGLLDARAALVSVLATTSQSISFSNPGVRGLGDGTFVPLASASSGLPLTLISSTPATCSILGNAIRLLALGTCTVVASQPGDATYFAAAPVSRSFEIKRSQTITLAPIGETLLSAGSIMAAVSASSGLPVALTSSAPAICSVAGLQVRLLALGNCVLSASQAGDAAYAPVAVTASFRIVNQLSADYDVPTLPEWGMLIGATLLLTQLARKRRQLS